jgi:hypothetical protein
MPPPPLLLALSSAMSAVDPAFSRITSSFVSATRARRAREKTIEDLNYIEGT